MFSVHTKQKQLLLQSLILGTAQLSLLVFLKMFLRAQPPPPYVSVKSMVFLGVLGNNGCWRDCLHKLFNSGILLPHKERSSQVPSPRNGAGSMHESIPRIESSLSAEWNARFIPDKIKETRSETSSLAFLCHTSQIKEGI